MAFSIKIPAYNFQECWKCSRTTHRQFTIVTPSLWLLPCSVLPELLNSQDLLSGSLFGVHDIKMFQSVEKDTTFNLELPPPPPDFCNNLNYLFMKDQVTCHSCCSSSFTERRKDINLTDRLEENGMKFKLER